MSKAWKIVISVLLSLAVVFIAVNVVLDFINGEYTESYQLYLALAIGLLIVFALFVLIVSKDKKRYETKTIAYAAVCIAVSFALSYLKVFRMPEGGSVTLASVALLALFSFYFGVPKGLLCCFIYGVLQAIQDPYIVHPVQFILDYPLAYTMMGLCGVFKGVVKNRQLALTVGIVLAVLLRYGCHVTAGAIFFAEYAPEGTPVLIYSLLYSATVLIDGALAAVAAVLLTSQKEIHSMLSNAALPNNEEV